MKQALKTRAEGLGADICRIVGLEPTDVRRLHVSLDANDVAHMTVEADVMLTTETEDAIRTVVTRRYRLTVEDGGD